MYVRKNTRVTFRSNKRHGHKRSNSFSNDRGRNKGNITQQYQKYLKLAKEASSSGDRIQSEYYYQFADHYSRLMLELGMFIEDNLEKKYIRRHRLQKKHPKMMIFSTPECSQSVVNTIWLVPQTH